MTNTHHIVPGAIFGRWTVLSGPHKETRRTANSVNYITVFLCRCSCGTERMVRHAKLLRNSQSCGCKKRADLSAKMTVHGENRKGKRTRLYSTWDGMLQRCTNPNCEYFAIYGGRGISVCTEWREFARFRAWAIASGHDNTLEIDRIDSNGNYCPENCRWVTRHVQHRNKRSVVYLMAFGELKCLTDWALDPRCNVTPSTIRVRLKNGLSPEEAVGLPRQSRKSSGRFLGNHVK